MTPTRQDDPFIRSLWWLGPTIIMLSAVVLVIIDDSTLTRVGAIITLVLGVIILAIGVRHTRGRSWTPCAWS